MEALHFTEMPTTDVFFFQFSSRMSTHHLHYFHTKLKLQLKDEN